jgi:chemotaxis protein CheZ
LRPYRIEATLGRATRQPDGEPSPVTDEILRELAELRRLMQPAEGNAADDRYRLAEAVALRLELESIQSAINETKQEIASLHFSTLKGGDAARATDELDAVAIGMEHATERILAAAEVIDETASVLGSTGPEASRRHAADIQEHVVALFEACNFQDIAGQRLSKVVGTLRFIETRIARMMDIWGGAAEFRALEIAEPEPAGATLLNGPSLPSDPDAATQDDIDALFARA